MCSLNDKTRTKKLSKLNPLLRLYSKYFSILATLSGTFASFPVQCEGHLGCDSLMASHKSGPANASTRVGHRSYRP